MNARIILPIVKWPRTELSKAYIHGECAPTESQGPSAKPRRCRSRFPLMRAESPYNNSKACVFVPFAGGDWTVTLGTRHLDQNSSSALDVATEGMNLHQLHLRPSLSACRAASTRSRKPLEPCASRCLPTELSLLPRPEGSANMESPT
jgi:hypothetical protein